MPPASISPTTTFTATLRASHTAQPNTTQASPTNSIGWILAVPSPADAGSRVGRASTRTRPASTSRQAVIAATRSLARAASLTLGSALMGDQGAIPARLWRAAGTGRNGTLSAPQQAEPPVVGGPGLRDRQACLHAQLGDLVRTHVSPGEPRAGLLAVPQPDLFTAQRGTRRLDLDDRLAERGEQLGHPAQQRDRVAADPY